MLTVISVGHDSAMAPLRRNSPTMVLNPIPLCTVRWVVLDDVLSPGMKRKDAKAVRKIATPITNGWGEFFFINAIASEPLQTDLPC